MMFICHELRHMYDRIFFVVYLLFVIFFKFMMIQCLQQMLRRFVVLCVCKLDCWRVN